MVQIFVKMTNFAVPVGHPWQLGQVNDPQKKVMLESETCVLVQANVAETSQA